MVSVAVMVSKPWLVAVSFLSFVSVAPLPSATVNTTLSAITVPNWSVASRVIAVS